MNIENHETHEKRLWSLTAENAEVQEYDNTMIRQYVNRYVCKYESTKIRFQSNNNNMSNLTKQERL